MIIVQSDSKVLENSFMRLEPELLKTIRNAVGVGAQMIEQKAKEKVPKWENKLHDSIHHTVKDIIDGTEALIGTDYAVGWYVEKGARTHHTRYTEQIERWFHDHGMKTPWDIGMWVDPHKTGKRHFVPFDRAPKLKEWYDSTGLGHSAQAVRFHKKAQPFLEPATKESAPQILALISNGITLKIETMF